MDRLNDFTCEEAVRAIASAIAVRVIHDAQRMRGVSMGAAVRIASERVRRDLDDAEMRRFDAGQALLVEQLHAVSA